MRRFRRLASVLGLGLLLTCGWVPLAVALQSSSTHYGVDQVQFGSGGQLNACDTNGDLCSNQALGETGAGGTCSTTYCAQAGGPETDRQPYLEFKVNNTDINVGTLKSSQTTTATATFSVKTYLAGGYTVVNDSPGPQNGSYTLKPLTTPTGPSLGNEQFGINLVANTCPSNTPAHDPNVLGSCPDTGGVSGALGANPKQVPDSSFSNGHAATNYNQPGYYMYKDGDTVATSSTSSGETDYTISYIFNVSDVTPGGTYTMDHVLVATSTF